MAKTYFNVDSIPKGSFASHLTVPHSYGTGMIYDYETDLEIYVEVDYDLKGYDVAEPYGLVVYGYDSSTDAYALYRPSESVLQDILTDVGFVRRSDGDDLCSQWFEYAFYEDEWLRDSIFDALIPYGAIPAYVEEVSDMDFTDGHPWYIPICRANGDYITDTDFPYLYTTNRFYLGDSILCLPCNSIWIHNDNEASNRSWEGFLWTARFKDPQKNYIEIPLLALSRSTSSWDTCEIGHLANIKANKDGQLICAGIVEPSDINLKSNIVDLDVDLNSLKNISKVVYTFINDEEQKQHIGVIAQEVQKYYPEIVNKGSDGYLSVDYAKLSVIALKAIDMLDDRLKAIEAKLGI